MPRVLDDLFEMVSRIDGAAIVHISYVELYKNAFRDLLANATSTDIATNAKRFVFTDKEMPPTVSIELHENDVEGVYLTGSPSLRTPVRVQPAPLS